MKVPVGKSKSSGDNGFRWQNFLLAEFVVGQKGNLPSSSWGSNVAALSALGLQGISLPAGNSNDLFLLGYLMMVAPSQAFQAPVTVELSFY